MNVKANMLIQNLPEVKSMYVMPSASDGRYQLSTLHYYQYATKNLIEKMAGLKTFIWEVQ